MAAGVLSLPACSTAGPPDQLYKKLGGMAGIERIVDNFMYEIGASDLLRPHFEQADLERFHSKLTEQICEVSGGPCRYSGDTMREVHAGMAINNRHFDATVTALIHAMEAAQVDTASQNALLKRLAALHGDIMADTEAP